jgi:hypothetical protein
MGGRFYDPLACRCGAEIEGHHLALGHHRRVPWHFNLEGFDSATGTTRLGICNSATRTEPN